MGAELHIIGIHGSMGAGKTTIRKHLEEEHGARWIAMAGPLKRALLGMGATDEEIYGGMKAEKNALWGGRTNRYAQQTLGTEWGRDMITPDIWVNCVRRQLLKIRDEREGVVLVVIDDVRFPNESAMIEGMGGLLWTVRRREAEFAPWKQKLLTLAGWNIASRWGFMIGIHASEAWWPMAPCDEVIENQGTQDDVQNHVDSLMGEAWK